MLERVIDLREASVRSKSQAETADVEPDVFARSVDLLHS
jgi:hypothetical protein